MLLISDLHQHVYYFVMQQKCESKSDTICIEVVAKHRPHTQQFRKKTAVGQKEIRIKRVMTFKVTIKIHHESNDFQSTVSSQGPKL